MPGPEIGVELVETALTFAPWLLDVPVLGRILRLIAPTGGDESHAIQELIKLANEKKADRKTRTDKNGRYVLKASEAMKCVDTNLNEGAVFFALGRAFLNRVAGKGLDTAPDILTDKIFTCIESKVLKQTSKRTKRERGKFARPAKGHGHGRKSPPPKP